MQRNGKEGNNSSSTFETQSTDGRGRRWTRAGSSRSSRWLGGGSVRSRRSSRKGQEARGMGLQQMGARQKEGRGGTLVIAKERKGGEQQQQHL